MTDQEQKAAMMDMILRFEAQAAKVACLESKIRDFAGPLVKLGNAIKQSPDTVSPSADDVHRYLLVRPNQKPEECEIDLARLRTLLQDLKEASDEKDVTERCLDDAGLARFIR